MEGCSYTVTVDPKNVVFSLSVVKNLQCLQTAGLHITIIASDGCFDRYSDWPPYIHVSSAFSPGRLLFIFIIHPHQKKNSNSAAQETHHHSQPKWSLHLKRNLPRVHESQVGGWGDGGDEVQLSHMHSSCWSSRDFPNQAKPEAGYSSKAKRWHSWTSQLNQSSKQARAQGERSWRFHKVKGSLGRARRRIVTSRKVRGKHMDQFRHLVRGATNSNSKIPEVTQKTEKQEMVARW